MVNCFLDWSGVFFGIGYSVGEFSLLPLLYFSSLLLLDNIIKPKLLKISNEVIIEITIRTMQACQRESFILNLQNVVFSSMKSSVNSQYKSESVLPCHIAPQRQAADSEARVSKQKHSEACS